MIFENRRTHRGWWPRASLASESEGPGLPARPAALAGSLGRPTTLALSAMPPCVTAMRERAPRARSAHRRAVSVRARATAETPADDLARQPFHFSTTFSGWRPSRRSTTRTRPRSAKRRCRHFASEGRSRTPWPAPMRPRLATTPTRTIFRRSSRRGGVLLHGRCSLARDDRLSRGASRTRVFRGTLAGLGPCTRRIRWRARRSAGDGRGARDRRLRARATR